MGVRSRAVVLTDVTGGLTPGRVGDKHPSIDFACSLSRIGIPRATASRLTIVARDASHPIARSDDTARRAHRLVLRHRRIVAPACGILHRCRLASCRLVGRECCVDGCAGVGHGRTSPAFSAGRLTARLETHARVFTSKDWFAIA